MLRDKLRLYIIVDSRYGDVILQAQLAAEHGATALQLRMKSDEKSEVLRAARKIREITERRGVLFIVNDYPEIAWKVKADGVHLGPEDASIEEAKEKYENLVIGATVHNPEEALIAQKSGADYLGAGSVYPTMSKKNAVVIGVEGLREIVRVSSIPVVAIGGITAENVKEVLGTGVAGVAVISYVMNSSDPKMRIEKLGKILKSHSQA